MQSWLWFRSGFNFSGVNYSFAAWPEVHQPNEMEVAVVFCKPHSILASVSQEVDFEQTGPHEVKLA